jgi:hypothetical protein
MVFELMRRIALPPPDVPLRNATLEALLVHLRLLDDFYGDPRQTRPAGRLDQDDVFARHWLPTWRPRRRSSDHAATGRSRTSLLDAE